MHAHHHRRAALGIGVTVLLALMALLLALPSRASAAPHHNHGLTIAATPDPLTAGAGVLIYGRLAGPDNAYRRVWLFHRINPATRFTPVSVTRTNGSGFYEFVRADGIVNSNRNWFVLGPDNSHSRTIHEWVSAAVTLSSSTATATTAQNVTFSGTVFPAHGHERVLLQRQNSTSGNSWQTIDSGYTNDSSAFTITHRFRSAGSYTLRAFFPADPRNIQSQSASISLTVQQQQNPSFTINGSTRDHRQWPDRFDHRHAVRRRLDEHASAERAGDAVRKAGNRVVPCPREHDDRQLRQLLVHPDAPAQHGLPRPDRERKAGQDRQPLRRRSGRRHRGTEPIDDRRRRRGEGDRHRHARPRRPRAVSAAAELRGSAGSTWTAAT